MRKKINRHKFTSLEKILLLILGIIVFKFIISFVNLPLLNFIPELKTEAALKRKYLVLVRLEDNKEYSKVYNLLSNELQKEKSLSDYLESMEKSDKKNNVKSSQVYINKIILDGNAGYIDRTKTNCLNENCSQTKIQRNYKKWVYENYHWRVANTPAPRCIRKEPYNIAPEFERALNLMKQRFNDWYKQYNTENLADWSYLNCLDIQYSNTDKTEGIFTLDEEGSNIDRLLIKVDYSYRNNDDLLTAFVLVHETTHANNYLNSIMSGDKISCVEDEVSSFYNQLLLGGLFNQEERESLNRRLQKGYNNLNNQLKISWDLLDLKDKARKICRTEDFNNCVMKEVIPLIEDMVRNNPYYQKQCGLN